MLLARVARRRGQAVEAKYANRLGSRATAVMLRHRDDRIDPVTKARYHRTFSSAGWDLPTAKQEATDIVAADEAYLGCITWLLEQTRDKERFKLLAEENIDYGFKRNLLGLRPIALPILMIAFVINLIVFAVHFSKRWDRIAWTATGVAVTLVVAGAVWLWLNLNLAQQASDTFAKRLLSTCDGIPQRRARTSASAKTERD